MDKNGKFVFDEELVKNFSKNCAMCHESNYMRFLNQPLRRKDETAIKFLRALHRAIEIKSAGKERKIDLSLEQQKAVVVEFYKSLNQEVGDEVKSILDGTNPMFDTNISSNDGLGQAEGDVGSDDNSKKINFNLTLDGTIDGLRTMAHEAAHAISARNKTSFELKSQPKAKRDEFYGFLGRFDVDCVGEIESKIIEGLFMRFLVNKEIISEADAKIFADISLISFKNDLAQILQEDDIIACFDHAITEEHPVSMSEFKSMIKRIKKTPNFEPLTLRVEDMAAPTHPREIKFAEYKVRYIIGQIIADVWMREYEKQPRTQRKEMKAKLVEFITQKTDKCRVQDASKFLLDRSLIDVASEFYARFDKKLKV